MMEAPSLSSTTASKACRSSQIGKPGKAAKALGLTMPRDILVLADEVIE